MYSGCLPLSEIILLTNKFCFCSANGCNDCTYIMKRLQEIIYLSNRKIYIFYVNFTTEQNHINRHFLLSSTRNRLTISDSTDCFNLIEVPYRTRESHMQDIKSNPFIPYKNYDKRQLRIVIHLITFEIKKHARKVVIKEVNIIQLCHIQNDSTKIKKLLYHIQRPVYRWKCILHIMRKKRLEKFDNHA